MKIGVVLEGGGLRGIYTAGILDVFIDKGLEFPYVIGVSAGSGHALSFVSKQKERSYKIVDEFIEDPRYLSFNNLFTEEKGVFGLDFVYETIPQKYIPFDYDTFNNTKTQLCIVATNAISGKGDYFYKDKDDMFLASKASSSLPLLAKPVYIKGIPYFDGGMVDPIPVKKAILDGCDKVIVILTRNLGYRKEESKATEKIMKIAYKNYPNLIEAYSNRPSVYNESLDYIDELERDGKAFVFRPVKPLEVKRLEKDKKKLSELYGQGVKEGLYALSDLREFIKI